MWINRRGFTLVELLVVIAIIGILSTIATVSLSQARQRARDTKRLADIQQIRSALVLYSNTRATYPDGQNLFLGSGSAQCLDDSNVGFHAGSQNDPCSGQIYMGKIMPDPSPGKTFSYTKSGDAYQITFELEGEIGDLKDGPDADSVATCTATPNGIICQ